MSARLPLVVSLHGSDVFVAERLAPARAIARSVFRRAGAVTACSSDLAERAVALGADAARVEVVPYGVDVRRFRPDAEVRVARRATLGLADPDVLVFGAGRLVSKKGFEYLIDAMTRVSSQRSVVLALAVGAALRIVGVRDWRCYAVALASPIALQGLFNHNLLDDLQQALVFAALMIVGAAWRPDPDRLPRREP